MTAEAERQPTEPYRDVPLDKLRLDPENPRLSLDTDWRIEPEKRLLQELFDRYNLRELGQSISDKGFRPRHAEALLVIANDEPAGTYTVIEGNRRLATLRLLMSEESRRAAGASSEWDEFSERAKRFELDPVPVIVYPDRKALDDYLGFRHITGPKSWRPEAKARFIARLLKSGESIDEVVRRIGSNHRTVRRYAEAHAIFEQAMKHHMPIDLVEAGFGIFYNALTEDGIRIFLGLGRQVEIQAFPESPVPIDRIDRLAQLIELLFGDSSKKLDRVIRESRELSKLADVLKDDVARANLIQERDLDRAWRSSGGGRVELLGLIRGALSRLAEAYGLSLAFPEDDEVRLEMKKIVDLSTEVANHYDLDQASR